MRVSLRETVMAVVILLKRVRANLDGVCRDAEISGYGGVREETLSLTLHAVLRRTRLRMPRQYLGKASRA